MTILLQIFSSWHITNGINQNLSRTYNVTDIAIDILHVTPTTTLQGRSYCYPILRDNELRKHREVK